MKRFLTLVLRVVGAVFFAFGAVAAASVMVNDPKQQWPQIIIIIPCLAGIWLCCRKKKANKKGSTKEIDAQPMEPAQVQNVAPTSSEVKADIPQTEAKPVFIVQTVSHRKENRERSDKGTSLLKALNNYTVLDLETTGLSPEENEIIEAAAIKVRSGVETDCFQTLIKPSVPISEEITELTGIDNEMVKDAPSPHDALLRLRAFTGSDPVVGHNVHFDINFLYDQSLRYGLGSFPNDFVDTLRISRKIHQDMPHHRLQDVAERLGVKSNGAHRAMADAQTTKSCYEIMKKELASSPYSPQQEPEEDDSSDWTQWRVQRDLYQEGENFRVAGDYERALEKYNAAEKAGYNAPALYEGYAMVYRALKQYDMEIAVLDRGIGHHAHKTLIERRTRVLALKEKESKRQEEEQAKEKQRAEKQAAKLAKEQEKGDSAKSKLGRPVLQLDADGRVIKRYDTITQAAREVGVAQKGIRSAAQGLQKTAGGFAWRYEDENN